MVTYGIKPHYRITDNALLPANQYYRYYIATDQSYFSFNITNMIMWLYSIGNHTLHGIITHPRMLFIARGRRPSVIIASEGV